jgi:hypothetical protein
VIAVRILAVLAAAFLVAAFAVATLWPPDMTLAALIGMVDTTWLSAAQSFTLTSLSPWIWEQLAVPVLQRPGWLVPTAIGLIFLGGAVTLSGPRGSRGSRTRRWRS